MTVLAGETAAPELIAETLRAELEGAGRDVAVVAGDEEAWTLIPGAGWAACARLLAAEDGCSTVTIAADEGGWRVSADGDLGAAAHMVVAAGGHVAGSALILPAAVP